MLSQVQAATVSQTIGHKLGLKRLQRYKSVCLKSSAARKTFLEAVRALYPLWEQFDLSLDAWQNRPVRDSLLSKFIPVYQQAFFLF